MIDVNENVRQRGIDPMPNLNERPQFKSDDDDAASILRAQFHGFCARCGGYINPGDAIEPDCYRGWAHIECGDPDEDDMDLWYAFMQNAGDR